MCRLVVLIFPLFAIISLVCFRTVSLVQNYSLPNKFIQFNISDEGREQVSSLSDPLLVVIETSFINKDVDKLAISIANRVENSTVVVVAFDGAFEDPEKFRELKHDKPYKVVRCGSAVSSTMVFSVIAYSQNDNVAILYILPLLALEDKEKSDAFDGVLQTLISGAASFEDGHVLRTANNEPYLGFYRSAEIRSIISSPCYAIVYREYNPLYELEHYQKNFKSLTSIACYVRRPSEPINDRTAVIFTVFKRNYWGSVLSSVCTQSIKPSILIFVQNEAHQMLNRTFITSRCGVSMELHHVWMTNWNTFCYMRHYVMVPTYVHNTVLVDDDQVLTPTAIESGLRHMRQNKCITSERGALIGSRDESRSDWKIVTSSSVNATTFVDYSFIPYFEDSEWRRSVYAQRPNSPVFGDILFASSAIYVDRRIKSCVMANFQFFIKNEGDDAFSTSKKNDELYNLHYNKIAQYWLYRGYRLVNERSYNCLLIHI